MASVTTPSAVYAQINLDMIAAQRIIIRKGNIVRVEFAAIGWIFIVLNDYFTIEIVHN
jgi:hypothetical protein